MRVSPAGGDPGPGPAGVAGGGPPAGGDHDLQPIPADAGRAAGVPADGGGAGQPGGGVPGHGEPVRRARRALPLPALLRGPAAHWPRLGRAPRAAAGGRLGRVAAGGAGPAGGGHGEPRVCAGADRDGGAEAAGRLPGAVRGL